MGSGDHLGLPFASVAIIDPGASPEAPPHRERFADSAGSFRLPPLPPGTYHLRARERVGQALHAGALRPLSSDNRTRR